MLSAMLGGIPASAFPSEKDCNRFVRDFRALVSETRRLRRENSALSRQVDFMRAQAFLSACSRGRDPAGLPGNRRRGAKEQGAGKCQ